MRLRYHQAAFDLFGEAPALSAEAVRLIEDWERRHGRAMPGSVREWYSLAGADTRLTVPEIEYRQEPLARSLTSTEEEWLAGVWGRPDLLPFLFVLDVRGEVNFYVRLHGGDDPGVFDGVDPDRMDEPFSEFVLGIVGEILGER